jgi:pantothenate kinase-related protein Tda10
MLGQPWHTNAEIAATPAAAAAAAAAGNVNFAPGACERLEPYLSSKLVGQELALRQITDAICDHLALDEPQRPLVLSLHGPPGVGKSMFHRLAAQALYNRRIHDALRCPGLDCAGYKVCEQRRTQLLQCRIPRHLQRNHAAQPSGFQSISCLLQRLPAP